MKDKKERLYKVVVRHPITEEEEEIITTASDIIGLALCGLYEIVDCQEI